MIKIIDKYNLYKNKYPKYMVLMKIGIFYECYGEDVYVLNNLFSYKIKDINGIKRVGFPINNYDRFIHNDLNLEDRINKIYDSLNY